MLGLAHCIFVLKKFKPVKFCVFPKAVYIVLGGVTLLSTILHFIFTMCRCKTVFFRSGNMFFELEP